MLALKLPAAKHGFNTSIHKKEARSVRFFNYRAFGQKSFFKKIQKYR